MKPGPSASPLTGGCAVLPFPLARRHAFVARHAHRMAGLRTEAAADKHLAAQLAIQAETMARRGIADHRIRAECSRLEAAIRAQLSTMIIRSCHP